MRKVIIESPYRIQKTSEEIALESFIASNSVFSSLMPAEEKHIKYARACLKDSLSRGEAPFASHLLYTQVLDDNNYGERCAGISAGLSWYACADACAVYIDKGISEGMEKGILVAIELNIPVEFRSLDADFKALEKGN